MTYTTMMADGWSVAVALLFIVLMLFVAPAVLSLTFSEIMRKRKWIKYGDMKLEM